DLHPADQPPVRQSETGSHTGIWRRINGGKYAISVCCGPTAVTLCGDVTVRCGICLLVPIRQLTSDRFDGYGIPRESLWILLCFLFDRRGRRIRSDRILGTGST